MQKSTKSKLAYGRVILDWQVVMMILARGHHMVEKIHTLPELPKGVYVHSVHNAPAYMGFEFILESEEPVEGWTTFCEEAAMIPLSPAGHELRAKIHVNVVE